MHSFLLFLAILTLLLYIEQGIEISRGARTLAHLDCIEPIGNDTAPFLSVVIPACNEAATIEAALASVLRQDYPAFEVIAVNDRSTDATGAILDHASQQSPRLRVVHISDLPAGWLGKNHALQTGAAHARGPLLLFTDADVVMDPSVLRRSAAYFEAHRLDHLAAAPNATVQGILSNAFLAVFALGFCLYTKPWRARDPRSPKHIGIGAFNLLRASAYWQAGGHAPIAMRPDDDLKLGKLIKLRGGRQDFVFATRLLSVAWYESFDQMRQGLMKNLFAGAEYRISAVVLSTIAQFLLLIWPFAALLATSGTVRLVNAAIVMAVCTLLWINSKLVGISGAWGLTLPLGSLVCIYLVWRAMLVTLLQDGIEWRGTRYPLRQLRANRI